MPEATENSSFLQDSLDKFKALSKQEQLAMFCAVTHKLVQAELMHKRSFRGTLYSEFGFDESAYGAAQDAGFIELHNSIFNKEEARILLDMAKMPLSALNACVKNNSQLSENTSVAEVFMVSSFGKA